LLPDYVGRLNAQVHLLYMCQKSVRHFCGHNMHVVTLLLLIVVYTVINME